MATSPLAGKPAPEELRVDLARREREYGLRTPDADDPAQRVSFGTSGHRGSSLRGSFNEAHILAITQAICDHRRSQASDGPLYMGKDTHALSRPAQRTALEVPAANGVETVIQRDDGVTSTPVISRAILVHNLVHNRGRKEHLADGIIVTPSHNPPDGGPPNTQVTRAIEGRANELLRGGNREVKRVSLDVATSAATTRQVDMVRPYVEDLCNVIDMEAIGAAGLRLAVDPLGGAAVHYWEPINAVYGLDSAVVNPVVHPTFAFMPVDYDGKIRMDCSSPYAMARLVGLIMNPLAAEITARTGRDPGEHYQDLAAEFGAPRYTRIDAAATSEQKARLGKLSPESVAASTLAGERITAKLTKARGNHADIGGLKVVAESGWFAARPSGTENIYKIYAESFKDERHLAAIVAEAQEIVDDALALT